MAMAKVTVSDEVMTLVIFILVHLVPNTREISPFQFKMKVVATHITVFL